MEKAATKPTKYFKNYLELQNQGFRTEANEVSVVKIQYRFD